MSRLKMLVAVLVIGASFGFSAGAAAKPQLAEVTVKGPKQVKAGGTAVFRVSGLNRGDEAAKNVVITVVRGGSGKATIARLAPGRKKTAQVAVRVKGKAGQQVSLRFRARTKGSKLAFITTRVRVTKPTKNKGGGGGGVIQLPVTPQTPVVNAGGR